MHLRPGPLTRIQLLLASPNWESTLRAFYSNDVYGPVSTTAVSTSDDNKTGSNSFSSPSSDAVPHDASATAVPQSLAPQPSSPIHSPTLAMDIPSPYFSTDAPQAPRFTAMNASHMALVAETCHVVKELDWDLETMENEIQSSAILVILLYLVNNEP